MLFTHTIMVRLVHTAEAISFTVHCRMLQTISSTAHEALHPSRRLNANSFSRCYIAKEVCYVQHIRDMSPDDDICPHTQRMRQVCCQLLPPW